MSPLLYHGRFKYMDRVAQTQGSDRRRPGPSLAVCSQVAEVSLGLSSDLLVTDLTPLPALIQRLGRLNRHELIQDVIAGVTFMDGEKQQAA